MQPPNKLTSLMLAAAVALVGAILFISLNATAARNMITGDSSAPLTVDVSPEPTGTITPTVTQTPAASLFMPYMSVFKTPEVAMLKAWTSETLDGKLQAFQKGVPMYYQSSGLNHLPDPVDISLNWQQSGPCDEGQIFSDTLTVPGGGWSHYITGTAPTCTGVFTATANMGWEYVDDSLSPRFVVNDPGTVQVNVQHGFDKCSHPDLADMQVWWDKSPYVVFNLYIGGISYACENSTLDAPYVRQLAEQGWLFIPTWVGPQAPCSKYNHKMSADRDTAYEEGRAEAAEAVSAAEDLGLFGDKIIYYDLESYSGDTKCRNTVKAFIRGWTEKLHELGSKAGAYGASCTSYIEDWVDNTPPLDDIWIAHWYLDRYDPNATVWDALCLSNNYWVNHQRLRQYAGGHSEPWGGVTLTIDSNVLDGEVVVLPTSNNADAPPNKTVLEKTGPELRDMELLDATHGWLLADDRLLWTEDGGDSWQEITPQIFSDGRILDVAFNDMELGWAVGRMDGGKAMSVANTDDGGQTWSNNRLPLLMDEVIDVSAAYLGVVDEANVYVALKLQSGSSFSLGRLYASQDGGVTWEERDMPLGEPVTFLDSLRGWTAGGAAGDQLYRTEDGGRSWHTQTLELPSGEVAQFGLPGFTSGQDGALPVIMKLDGERTLVIYRSRDRGDTWVKERETSHRHYNSQAITLDFVDITGESGVKSFADTMPEDVTSIARTPQGQTWVITQQGGCEGDKRGSDGEPVVCTQHWNLLRSFDGGRTWMDITP